MPRRRRSQPDSRTLPRPKERADTRTAPESERASSVSDAFDPLHTEWGIVRTEDFLPPGTTAVGEGRSTSAEIATPRVPVFSTKDQTAENHRPEPGPRLLALLGRDFSQTTFERHAALLGDRRLSQPSARRQRAMIAQQLQRDYGNRYVQRLVEHIARTKAGAIGPEGGEAGPEVESAIARDKGQGRTLPEDFRTPMEDAFGADFGDVRIHDDARADTLSEALNARAFTAGQDIFFKRGEYDPGSPAGKETIAHELTHVVQQNGTQKDVVERAREEDEATLEDSAVETPEAGIEDGMSATAETSTEPASQPVVAEQSESPSTNGKAAALDGMPETPTPKADTSRASYANGASSESTSDAVSEEVEMAPAEESFAPASGEPVMAGASGGEMPDGADGFGDTGDGEEAQSCSLFDNLPAVIVIKKLVSIAKGQAAHPPEEDIAAKAQAAAEPPTEEVKGQAAAAQMENMNLQQPQPFDSGPLNSVLKDGLRGMRPGSLGEMDSFKKGNKLRSLKGSLVDAAGQGAKQAKSGFEEKAKEKPDTGAVKPQPFLPLQPLQPGPPSPEVDAAAAIPRPRPVSDVTDPLNEAVQEIEQEMEEAGITEELLENSNDPSFFSALNLLNLAKGAIAKSPEEHEEGQETILSKAQDTALKVANSGLDAVHSVREKIFDQVSGFTGKVSGKFEEARAKVYGHIEAIYNETRKTVEACLSRIDTDAVIAVRKGVTEAQEAFESYVDRKMAAYKKKRYSGRGGEARWVRDKVLGPPLEVIRFYIQGRRLYMRRILALSGAVSLVIKQAIAAARAAIADGIKRVHEYIASLPAHLMQVGIEAAITIGNKFKELEQKVKDMLRQFIDALIQKYYEFCNALEKAVETLRSGVGGLIEKAIDAIMPIIKTIIQLAGMILKIADKAEAVIGMILEAPAAFLENLINAIIQGFIRFMSKVVDHVKNGLIEWLTGNISAITERFELPEKWDLQGVFGLVAQVLGYTYENIRNMAVGVFGERAVKVLETGFELFKVLKNDGVAGLWDYIESKATSAILQVMLGIQGVVIMEIVEEGFKWLLKFLVSALTSGVGAIIPVALKIIDIIRFIIDDAKEMVELVDSILNSITAIAQGKIGGAAKLVEQSLADSVPILISFLARMIGVGGIDRKIQKVMELPQKPIEMAMQWVFNLGKKFIAMLLGKGKGKPGEEEADGAAGESDPEVRMGLAAIEEEHGTQLEEGVVSQDEARKVAASVESRYPIFESIKVSEDEDAWVYEYKVSSTDDDRIEEEVRRKPLDQGEESDKGGEVGPDVESAIQKSTGRGQPLPDETRSSMESAFGADFSNVRIHTDDEADALSHSLSARAFTAGQDIFFRREEGDPESASGKELLAHELTHVIQQKDNMVRRVGEKVKGLVGFFEQAAVSQKFEPSTLDDPEAMTDIAKRINVRQFIKIIQPHNISFKRSITAILTYFTPLKLVDLQPIIVSASADDVNAFMSDKTLVAKAQEKLGAEVYREFMTQLNQQPSMEDQEEAEEDIAELLFEFITIVEAEDEAGAPEPDEEEATESDGGTQGAEEATEPPELVESEQEAQDIVRQELGLPRKELVFEFVTRDVWPRLASTAESDSNAGETSEEKEAEWDRKRKEAHWSRPKVIASNIKELITDSKETLKKNAAKMAEKGVTTGLKAGAAAGASIAPRIAPFVSPVVNTCQAALDTRRAIKSFKLSSTLSGISKKARDSRLSKVADAADYASKKVRKRGVRKGVGAAVALGTAGAGIATLALAPVAPVAAIAVGVGVTIAGISITVGEPILRRFLKKDRGKHRRQAAEALWDAFVNGDIFPEEGRIAREVFDALGLYPEWTTWKDPQDKGKAVKKIAGAMKST